MRIISIIYFTFYSIVLISQPHLAIELSNRQISMGNTVLSFDVYLTALSGYSGDNDNWQGLSATFDISGPNISSVNGSVDITNAQSLSSTTSIPGSSGISTDFRINATRNLQPDIIIDNSARIGSISITLSNPVTSASDVLITFRASPSTNGSFWSNPEGGSRPLFGSAPLPITLSSFSATKHSDRASKLDWTTSSEINSAYFGIERSRDGDDWETITKVNAAGNSNEELTYEYIDDQLPFTRSKDNIFYYRIRLTDQDGTHKYSDIKGVNFSREVADGLISIYPNPATQMVHLDVSGLELDNVETKLNIFDMYGRSMLQKAITGSGLEPIDVQNYPAGVYNISVTQGDKLHQKQFIKID